MNDGTTDINVALVRSYSLTENAETVDTSAMGTNYRTHVSTMKGFEGSLTVLYDPSDAGHEAMTVGNTVTLKLYMEGTSNTDTLISGDVIISSLEITGDYEGLVEANANFTGTGALTRNYPA